MSNSCLQSRKDYLQSLVSKGYNGKLGDIFTASFACAQYLKDIGFSKTVYVLGPSAIGEELDESLTDSYIILVIGFFLNGE